MAPLLGNLGGLNPLQKDKQFVLEWHREFKWKKNPFVDNLYDGKLFAGWKDERQKLNFFFIKKFRYGIIQGEEGTGKTMLLAWLENELAKYKKSMVMVKGNCKNLKTEMEWINRIMKEVLSFYDETIKRTHSLVTPKNFEAILQDKLNFKTLVLLIDDIDEATPETVKLIERLNDSQVQIEIVVTGTEKGFKKTGLSSLKTALKIELGELQYEDLKDMLQKRIEYVGGVGIYPFNDTLLKNMCTTAKNNPRKLLETSFNAAIKLSIKKSHNREQGVVEEAPVRETRTKKIAAEIARKTYLSLKIGSIYTAKGIAWLSKNIYQLSKQGYGFSKEKYGVWKQNREQLKSHEASPQKFETYKAASTRSGENPVVEDADTISDVSLDDIEEETQKEDKKKKSKIDNKSDVEKTEKIVKGMEKKAAEKPAKETKEKSKMRDAESLVDETDALIKELERGL